MKDWQLDFRQTAGKKRINYKYIQNIINRIFKKLKFYPSNIYISVNIVGDKKSRSLNRKYRKVDKVTDVLSFGSLSKSKDFFSRKGEIFINYYKIEEGDKYGNTFNNELEVLLTHGILHLLGYSHSSSQAQKKMKDKEKLLVKKGLISR